MNFSHSGCSGRRGSDTPGSPRWGVAQKVQLPQKHTRHTTGVCFTTSSTLWSKIENVEAHVFMFNVQHPDCRMVQATNAKAARIPGTAVLECILCSL